MCVSSFPGSVAVESHGQSVVYVDRTVWRDAVAYLRSEEHFTQCADVTAVELDRIARHHAGIDDVLHEAVLNLTADVRRLLRAENPDPFRPDDEALSVPLDHVGNADETRDELVGGALVKIDR